MSLKLWRNAKACAFKMIIVLAFPFQPTGLFTPHPGAICAMTTTQQPSAIMIFIKGQVM